MASPNEQFKELIHTLEELPEVFRPGVRIAMRRAFTLGAAHGVNAAFDAIREMTAQQGWADCDINAKSTKD